MVGKSLLLLAAAVMLSLALACGSDRVGRQDGTPAAETPPADNNLSTRFLLGGWLVPEGVDPAADPFAEILEARIITSEERMRQFLDSVDLVRVRGNQEILDRVNYNQEVAVVAFYMWRPLKGDPLSLDTAVPEGTVIRVNLELEDDPPGRERPFLAAPFYLASFDRGGLPIGTPPTFVFSVNGTELAMRTITLE